VEKGILNFPSVTSIVCFELLLPLPFCKVYFPEKVPDTLEVLIEVMVTVTGSSM
jgi:hypothetical protein